MNNHRHVKVFRPIVLRWIVWSRVVPGASSPGEPAPATLGQPRRGPAVGPLGVTTALVGIRARLMVPALCQLFDP